LACHAHNSPFGYSIDPTIFADQEILSERIYHEVFRRSGEGFSSKLATELCTVFSASEGYLFLISDGGDELLVIQAKGYRCIGTRYKGDTGEMQRIN
jgi:hypothetical protein